MKPSKLSFGATPWDTMTHHARAVLAVDLGRALDQAADLITRFGTEGPDADYWTNPTRDGGKAHAACACALKHSGDIATAARAATQRPNDLLKTIARLYHACLSAKSVLGICAQMEASARMPPNHDLYVVGIRLDATLATARRGYDGETIYDSFLRQATDLLFPDVACLQRGWCVCATCHTVVAGPAVAPSLPCVSGTPGCTGIFRPYAWADLTRPDLAD